MKVSSKKVISEELIFTVPTIAKLIGCSKRSVYTWIKSGYLTGKWSEGSGKWGISQKNLVRFLYLNPKYRRRIEANSLKGLREAQRRTVLEAVHQKKPIIMDITDIALKFSISEDTVATWMRRKSIQPTKSKFAISKRIYSTDAIRKFFDKNPYYKRSYGLYLEEGITL